MRTWFKIGALCSFVICCIPPMSYLYAGLAADGDGLVQLTTYTSVPWNIASRMWGRLVSSEWIPQCVHTQLVRFFVWLYSISLEDVREEDRYPRTLQHFFCRQFKVESRPVDQAALVVAPCDGELVSCFDASAGDVFIQVKGCKYGLARLFDSRLPPRRCDVKRMCFVLHLRSSDVHHFYSPLLMRGTSLKHIPGLLFPTTPTGMRWIPNVFAKNERVCLLGSHACGFAGLAFVGGALCGKIRLLSDGGLDTNKPVRRRVPHEKVFAERPLFAPGDHLGWFEWGSAIVVVVDLPAAAKTVCRIGQSLKMGEALAVPSD